MPNSGEPNSNIRKVSHLDHEDSIDKRLRKKCRRLTNRMDDYFERLADEFDDMAAEFISKQDSRFNTYEDEVKTLYKTVDNLEKQCSCLKGQVETLIKVVESFQKSSDQAIISIAQSSDEEEENQDSSNGNTNALQAHLKQTKSKHGTLFKKDDKQSKPIEFFAKEEENIKENKANQTRERLKPTEEHVDSLIKNANKPKKSKPDYESIETIVDGLEEEVEEEEEVEKDDGDGDGDDDDDEDYEEEGSSDCTLARSKRKKVHVDKHIDLTKNEEGQSELSSLDHSLDSKVTVKSKSKSKSRAKSKGNSKQEAEWNNNFEKLRQYKIKNGHCDPAKISKDDQKLGNWATRRRSEWYNLCRGAQSNAIRPERAMMLVSIGLEWPKKSKYPSPLSWDEQYEKLKSFHKANGHCKVPLDGTDPIPLATWLSFNRTEYKKVQESKDALITEEQIEKLNVIGMDWEVEKV